MLINLLLLTDQKPIAFLISSIVPILLVGSVWFWVDLNEEIDGLPLWKPLPLTLRIWRWALSFYGVISVITSYLSLSCMKSIVGMNCLTWIEAPKSSFYLTKNIFSFLFGANWNTSLAGFIGYVGLIFYLICLLQWLIVKCPRQGRISGGF